MISRRRYLAASSAALAGAAAGVVAGAEPFPESWAAPGVPADERFRHRGRDVRVVVHGSDVHVLVDGRKKVHVDRSGRRFVTHLLPFTEYVTVRQLAEGVIDAEAAQLFVL